MWRQVSADRRVTQTKAIEGFRVRNPPRQPSSSSSACLAGRRTPAFTERHLRVQSVQSISECDCTYGLLCFPFLFTSISVSAAGLRYSVDTSNFARAPETTIVSVPVKSSTTVSTASASPGLEVLVVLEASYWVLFQHMQQLYAGGTHDETAWCHHTCFVRRSRRRRLRLRRARGTSTE